MKQFTYRDLTGMIFHRTGAMRKSDDGYWKVTGPPRKSMLTGNNACPVIKCTKTGKEFRKTTSYSYDSLIGCLTGSLSHLILIRPPVELPREKCDIDAGQKRGVKKRRVQYLEERIAQDQKELAKLQAELHEEFKEMCGE